MEAYEIEQRVRRELSSEEQLLWSGQPGQGLMLRGSDAWAIPVSLLWAGFAIFWEVSVIRLNSPLFMKLWGIPFVLAGVHMVFGRFITDAMERGRTAYAVTSQRVLIVSGLFRETVKSVSLRSLADMSLSERSDGTGTTSIGPSPPTSWFAAGGWPGTRRNLPPTLEGIRDARSVHELIRQAQKRAA